MCKRSMTLRQSSVGRFSPRVTFCGSLREETVSTISRFDINYDIMPLNKKQRVTLGTIFKNPVQQNIRWTDVESLIRALGGTVQEREGSRVALKINGAHAVFHRPHSKRDTDKNTVRDLRDFLERAGLKS